MTSNGIDFFEREHLGLGSSLPNILPCISMDLKKGGRDEKKEERRDGWKNVVTEPVQKERMEEEWNER